MFLKNYARQIRICSETISILVLRNSWLSPRDASYKIFNRLTSRDDSALWDNREDCKEWRKLERVKRVSALFGSHKTWVCDAYESSNSTYLDPYSDNAAGTIGRRWRSEVLEVELDRRWDQGLACYWWPGRWHADNLLLLITNYPLSWPHRSSSTFLASWWSQGGYRRVDVLSTE